MMMRRLTVIAAVLGAALAGCGGSSPHRTVIPGVKSPPKVSTPLGCPAGKSFMGCSASGAQLSPTAQLPLAISGPEFSDVSSWQGHPNWAAAKPYIDGAAVKATEYRIDPDFIWNVQHLKALKMRWVAYDFVRSCDASTFISALRDVGGPSGPPIFDMEVRAAYGCAPRLERQLYAAFHIAGVIYSSPGLAGSTVGNSDGLSVWVAAYGPSSPPCLFTCSIGVRGRQSILAWQFTDGRSGSPVYIPGIGHADVNRDYGLMSRVALPPPPDPYAIYPKARFLLRHGVRASEHNTVATWHHNGCEDPARRPVCKSTHYHAALLRDRVWFIAHHRLTAHGWVVLAHARWSQYHLGLRFGGLSKIAR